MHTSHSHSSGKIHQPTKPPTTEPTPAAASSERERERDRDRERDRESGRSQSNVPPPVRQRASTSGSAAGALKARVPPPVPPRGSPRRKDTQDTSRAHSTTPGTAASPYDLYPNSSTASVSVSSSNLLQLPSEAMPRFGERRSPSNVQDWLELHDLFDVCDTPSPSPAVATVSPARRRESMQSAYSTVRSESSHRQPQPPRLLNHVDIFQRQNSFMARSDRSSVGSIVRSFPPIRAESYRTARTSVSAFSSHRSPRRHQQQQLKRHEKRNRYLHCADLALGDDSCDSGQEDNLLQSVSAFLEVKRELEGVYNRRRPLPTLQVEQEQLTVEQQQEGELFPAEPAELQQRRPRRGKRRAPKAAPSTIPESTDSVSNAATQHDSIDLRRNSCA